MRRISALWASVRPTLVALATLPVRVVEGAWDLLTDDAARPATLYLLALALGGLSFASYLLGGGGAPSNAEFGLQLGSFGVLFYMSLRQAGGGGGGRRR